MPALRELQQRFAAALYGGDASSIAELVIGGGFAPQRRIQIYRHNLLSTLTEALTTHYPVVRQIVGDEYFTRLTRDYVDAHPSRSGSVADYGDAFAAFLTAHEIVATLPYLPDVARLEWAAHCATRGGHAAAFPMDRLAALDEASWDTLCLRLHPSAQLLALRDGVLALWRAHHLEELDRPLALGDSEEFLLALRRQDEVEFVRVADHEYEFLSSCAHGRTFVDACEAAGAKNESFDPAAFLTRCIAEQFIVDFTLPAAPDSEQLP